MEVTGENLFHHDNARVHNVSSMKTGSAKAGMKALKVPNLSPDLNLLLICKFTTTRRALG